MTAEGGGKDAFSPYPHQEKATQEMTKHFLDKKQRAGLLVIPTGGGKTAVTARWLLKSCVSQGKRVLWLAHRHNLLTQAFQCFAKYAHLAAPLKRLGLISVGGATRRWSEVDSSYQVVFSTMQTTGRVGNLGFVEQMLNDSPQGLVVVIDEAHHAAAPSYWRIAGRLKPREGVHLLGLTATPVRMQAADDTRLWNVFDHKIIHQVDIKDLMEKGILANPHTHTIKTHIDFEHDFTEEDLNHLKRFGELGQQVLERVGKSSTRNRFIVQHYIEHQEKYGKTIVFATDTLHARTLNAEFAKSGVSVDYVDYTRGPDNARIMESFRTKTIPKVLINVEMLTEGYDAPDTKTIFIARPTNSESLVAQMVGRALRGVHAGGTKDAHLVTFEDTWKRFQVLTPEFIGVTNTEEVTDPETQARLPAKLLEISHELLAAAYEMVQSNLNGSFDTIFSCIPTAWYVWEEEYEDNVIRKSVMVFDNQMEGFSHLEEDLERLPDVVNEEEHGQQLLEDYFQSCPDPRPRPSDLCALINSLQRERNPEMNANDADVQMSAPTRYTFAEKEDVSPIKIATRLFEEDVSRKQEAAWLLNMFEQEPLLKVIYRNDLKTFSEEVRKAVATLSDAVEDSAAEAPPAIVEVVNQVTEKVKPWPAGNKGYNLNKIWTDVCAPKAHFNNDPPQIRDIQWVKSKAVWGFFRYEDRFIGVNEILNSPDIPLFVVEFLVYHEGLHADMPDSKHDAAFRERERRFTPSAEAVEDAKRRGISSGGGKDGWRTRADQFLDTFKQKFVWAPPKQEM